MRTLIWMSVLTLCRDRVALALTFLLPALFVALGMTAALGPIEPAGPVLTVLVDGPVAKGEMASSPSSRHLGGRAEGRSGRELVRRLAAHPLVHLVDADRWCGEDTCSEESVVRGLAERRYDAALRLGQSATGRTSGDPPELWVARDALSVPSLVAFALSRSVTDRTTDAALQTDPALRPVAVDLDGAARRTGARVLAGLIVPFLLFLGSGASGWLIEEERQATLGLLLSTRLGIRRILAAQGVFLTGTGVVQGLWMCGIARLGFGVGWTGATDPFLGVAALTSTAALAASLGIVLATLCRTRAQMSGVSTLVILALCGLGALATNGGVGATMVGGGPGLPEQVPTALRFLADALPTSQAGRLVSGALLGAPRWDLAAAGTGVWMGTAIAAAVASALIRRRIVR